MICIVSEEISNIAFQNLKKITNNIIRIKKYMGVYPAISAHVDIQCFNIEKNSLLVHPLLDKKTLDEIKENNIKVIMGKSIVGEKYPENIAYNAVRVGNLVLHNTNYTDSVLKEEALLRGYKLINVKQGYTKCSVLVIDNNSIITSDSGIADVAMKNNIEVLLVDRGNIELQGLNYGFIGGASGTNEENGIIAFNGNIKLHPNYNEINEFINGKGFEHISLIEGKLFDIGSIFFI
ncbi:MAG: DUF6873 family GME fold protein [Eubacteriaceae bacterium]